MKLNFALLVLCIVCSQVNCQMCGNATTCEGCYEIPDCAWCSDSNIDISLRCFPINSTNSTVTCRSIENRESSVELEERALTFDNQVSISKATLRLRAGNSRTFKFDVRAAENFPLDLYMIVDLSNSLRDDLDNIKNVSSDIADTIRNISTRFQVGLGTYVDKLVEPYVGRAALLQALDGGGGMKSSCLNTFCIRPLSYVHNINLTNSSAEFTNGTSTLEISTNADNPEGTFDAMAQSVLCKDVVGWRDNSRKILIVITDAVIHMAGDGILAGIGLRAPMECKTRYDPEQDVYTYVDNLEFDYPSIEQIRILFEQNLVSPVFALSGDVEDFYESLADQLASTNPQVVRIAADSRDIIQAIQRAYENIVSAVSLSFNVGTEAISISTSVTCPEEAIENDDGVSCSNVTTNQTVNFEVTVTLNACTDELRDSSRMINVNVPGYGQFVIEVAGICSCDCEETAVMNSPDCSGQGSLTCGICMCNTGWIGDTCNCESSVTIACQEGPNGEECSGSSRGECLCGDCVCNSLVARKSQDNNRFYEVQDAGTTILLIEPPRIYGETCECDNFRCERNAAGVVCSGEQGNCTCDGACTCHSAGYGDFQYFGDACECSRSLCYNTSIPFTSTMTECNGNGICQPCNQESPCNCEPGFLPPFCTQSAFSLIQCFPSGSTERNCVECIAENSDYTTSCLSCLNSLSHNYSRLDSSKSSNYEIPDSVNGTETTRCTFDILDPICTYVYFLSIRAHSDAPNGLQLRVEVEPLSGCFPLRFWQIALILLGGLIILGIIILAIVKIIFMVLDYIEVKNLDKSVAETDLSKNFNPLYQSPEVKYDNVAFGKE